MSHIPLFFFFNFSSLTGNFLFNYGKWINLFLLDPDTITRTSEKRDFKNEALFIKFCTEIEFYMLMQHFTHILDKAVKVVIDNISRSRYKIKPEEMHFNFIVVASFVFVFSVVASSSPIE